jgi:hypothetical protein
MATITNTANALGLIFPPRLIDATESRHRLINAPQSNLTRAVQNVLD